MNQDEKTLKTQKIAYDLTLEYMRQNQILKTSYETLPKSLKEVGSIYSFIVEQIKDMSIATD